MTYVPPAGQPPIPPSTFSIALPIQPNYLSEICGNDLAWLRTFFTLFLSLTFPLWTGPLLSRLLGRLLGRDSDGLRAGQPTTTTNPLNTMFFINNSEEKYIFAAIFLVTANNKM